MKLTALAISNIKRNFKKYIMYFFSLTFSVFTAYSFLALLENEPVKTAFIYYDRYTAMLTSFGIIIMVFVMFFLISSNNSFIRARKREISMYSLFGMTNGKIGKLLFLETMIVGFTALIIGIGFGIFLSKLTAMILVDISLMSFVGDIKFTIEPRAIYITAGTFIIIFCIMGLSGLRVINKFELVELFKAHKMSEGRPKGSIIGFIFSIMLIGTGYYLAASSSPQKVFSLSIIILVLVICGTYLFFWNGLPKVLQIIKRNKKRYYDGVNLISISMFYHRIKSIGSVMATIAVLSAVATTAIATGFTLYSSIEKDTYNSIGYDLYFYGGQEELLDDIYRVFDKHNVKIIEEYTAQRYACPQQIEPIIVDEIQHLPSKEGYFRVYSQSVYNKLVSISRNNLKPADINYGEALYIFPYLNKDLENAVKGQLLTFSDRKIKITSVIKTNIVSFGALHTIVLNDRDFDELMQAGDISILDKKGNPYYKVTVFIYENPLKSHSIADELSDILSADIVGSYRIAYTHYNEALQTFGLVCFIGFFMSAIFILMTASLLYFKQIMAAEDEREQYKTLRKIGMDGRVEKRVIAKRLIPVFLIPLIVGIIHSIFAMKAADTIVFSNIIYTENSYFTVLGFSAVMYAAYTLVYGIFYLITKGQYSRIVK